LDESTQQEGAEEGAGSEKKCCAHGDAEQVHRCVAELESEDAPVDASTTIAQ
jgi:hypothetical protein